MDSKFVGKVKSAYDDHDVESFVTGLECEDVSLAVQSSRDEVDINTIVRRFGLTGQLPHDLSVPQFVDFDEVHDFHSAMNLIAEARDSFMAMPADVRARFDNDPQGLVAFVSDPANLEEARKLGIAVPEAAADPLLQAIRDLKPSEHLHDPAKPVLTSSLLDVTGLGDTFWCYRGVWGFPSIYIMRTILSDAECFQLVKHFGLEVWCREVEFGKWEWGVSGRSHWVKASGPDLNEVICEYVEEVVCVR